MKKKASAIIKLDFQKAYDRVKWCFVDTVLEKIGFGRTWRAWVRECVTSASISILINGSPSKPFKMERGLRQGDPLSPFLFVLVVDLLNMMIGEAEETVRNYKRLLRCFEMMSGLSINFEKSNLIPVNCNQEWVNRMCQLLGCQEAALPVRYLGINLGVNARLMPNAVARRIISLQRKFFWKKDDGRPGMALVKWEMIQAPKKLGGLGILPKREGPWRDICQVQKNEQHVRQKMIDGLAKEVGDGRSTRFWEDTWLQVGKPKDNFPRLFLISNQKGLVIGDCGFWDGIEWVWHFQWRRELRQWETNVLNQLLHVLQSVLQEETLDEELLSYRFTKEIWKGLVPPRVKLFSWFVLVWCAWVSVFGQEWIIPGTVKEQFESWRFVSMKKEIRKYWLVEFFSVIWTIWLRKNDVIFHNKITGIRN
ncbi:uncharacterized protein [Arachis hypogaea]|uniref:uncharacterized protein n=1 Tax=Arachis hypogaea TaxID=3818 RepID=UPI0010FC5528|nr:uncharacterized protein LOC114924297 [Arachis hypogaea]